MPEAPTEIDQLVTAGEAAYADGDLDRAEALFRAALDRDPSHATALGDLAVLNHQRGDLDAAELYLLRAAVFAADPEDPLVNLAAIARARGHVAHAAAYLERGLARVGETPAILDQMAQLSEDVGDLDTARALYRKARASSPPVPYRAAFARRDITPDLDDPALELQGYYGPPRHPTDVTAPLTLHLLLLEDALGTRALIVAADIFGFGPEMLDALTPILTDYGLDPGAVLLNASHTHYAPGTLTHTVPGLGRFHPAYATRVCNAIADALPRLHHDLRPAELAHARADAQIGLNRRRLTAGRVEMAPAPTAHYERETPVIRVAIDRGPTVLLVNHGCHPTGLGRAATLAPDFPGALRRTLIDTGHADGVLFLQGAAGDIKQARDGQFSHSAADVDAAGHHLADAVIAALDDLTPIHGPIRAHRRPVVAPLRPAPPDIDPGVPDAIRRTHAAALEQLGVEPADALRYDLDALALGEALLIAVPAEPMAITAHRIRRLATRHDLVAVLGYTNGLTAYLPAEEMIPLGGYEAHGAHCIYLLPAPFGPGVEQTLLAATRAAAAATTPPILRGDPPPLPPLERRAFFVLSTGRSGTQTLAHLLEPATNAKVWHHPQPYLIEETLAAYHGAIDRHRTFWQGRGGIIRAAWDAGLVHGETDHNMTPFCEAIAQDIPAARFIILVRDPREFIRSGMRRGYYRATGDWERGRLRPAPDDPRHPTWGARPQFDQIAWLWAETYRHIERIRAAIGPDRVRLVRFEDLTRDPDETRAIYDFLQLDGHDPAHTRAVLGQKLNAQRYGDFPHPADWSADLHARCWAEVGPLATRYGYPEDYRARSPR